MIDPHSEQSAKPMSVVFVAISVSLLMGCLIYAVISAGVHQNPMYELLNDQIHRSGVSNPVTAVLLNFRAYDTLIEFAVFFCVSAASLPYLNLQQAELNKQQINAGPFFNLVKLLVPLLVLLAGYLLWVGSFKPGGAFQAGALLAGSGLLLTLANLGVRQMLGIHWRTIFALGLLFFLLSILGSYGFTHRFMQYPEELAGGAILFIEFGATLSVAATLYLCYLSVRGETRSEVKNAG